MESRTATSTGIFGECSAKESPARFPVEVLPSWIAKMANATAHSLQTPVDLSGSIALGAISQIASRRSSIQINSDWIEQLNILVAIGMETGTGKSATYNAMLAPLETWQQKTENKWKIDNCTIKQRRKIMEMRIALLEKQAVHADNKASEEESITLAAELNSMPTCYLPRLCTSDITPEGIVRVLDEQGGYIGLFSPEGGEVFSNLTGRYTKGHSNFDVLLKGFSGDTITVDRADRTREAVIIRNPSICGILCVQPQVVETVVSSPKLIERGLIGRFAWVMPVNLLGEREIEVEATPIHVKQLYHSNMQELLSLGIDISSRELRPLVLSDDADELFINFRKELEPKLAWNGTLGHMVDWASRLSTLIAKLAGILHSADEKHFRSPWESPISADTMRKAFHLGDYFCNHASQVYQRYTKSSTDVLFDRVIKQIQSIGNNDFSTREIYRELGLPSNRVKLVLENLSRLGLICKIPPQTNSSISGRKKRSQWRGDPIKLGNFVNSDNHGLMDRSNALH